jgi:hypothetical protein
MSEQSRLSSEESCSDFDQKVSVFFLSLPTGDLCDVLVVGADFFSRNISRQLINLGTEKRQNFILFSIYTTELPRKKITVLGIMNNFFLLSSE